MPSNALVRWTHDRAQALDEIKNAHKSVGGSGPGRRFATLQINYSYAVLLSSQFQGYCRDLHSEAVDHIAKSVLPAMTAQVVRVALTQGRKLDFGNPNAGNLGADFGRLGMPFWSEVRKLDSRNSSRQKNLDELNEWRNAIAHQDFSKVVGTPSLSLGQVHRWHSCLNALARDFDRAVRTHIHGLAGTPTW